MAIIIALSLGLVPLVKLASTTSLSYGGGTGVMEYYGGGDYRFLGYSFNTYGQPVVGTRINVTFSGSGAPPSSSGTTNSSGFANWSVPGSPPTSQYSIIVSVSGNVMSEGQMPPPRSPGEALFLGGNPLPFVVDPSNSSRTNVLFFYEGPNGTPPTGYRVYYNFSSSSGPSSGPLNESQMTLLGSATSYVSIFKLPPFPSGTLTVSVAAYTQNGTLITLSSTTYQSGGIPPPPNPQGLFTAFTGAILGLVVPLMAILVTYNSYGKDRATGVLESVLSRPVTRRGLGLSRYLSILISLSVAIVIMMAVMEGESQILLGKILDPTFAVYSVVALVVEVAAFIGIMMLVSQRLKSTGAIIGVGIGLWVILDFFWGILILLGAYLVGVQIGSGNYLGLTIDSSFLNPAQFYSLVAQYVGGTTISTSSGGSIPISPATYGLTPLTLAAAAAIWVILPLAGFLYLSTHRD